jgi:hypothetical protein
LEQPRFKKIIYGKTGIPEKIILNPCFYDFLKKRCSKFGIPAKKHSPENMPP